MENVKYFTITNTKETNLLFKNELCIDAKYERVPDFLITEYWEAINLLFEKVILG